MSLPQSQKSRPLSKLFYIGMALLMTVVVFAGFWPSYFGLLLSGQEFEGHWTIHVHAIVFMGWMALLITQATLIFRKQTGSHMTIGRYGMMLGVVVFIVGLYISLMSKWRVVSEYDVTWARAILGGWQSLIVITLFGILLTLGFLFRKRSEWHKRYMILATLAVVQAATDRMGYILGEWSMEIMFVFIVGTLFAYDIYSRNRIHPASLTGTAILALFFVARVFIE